MIWNGSPKPGMRPTVRERTGLRSGLPEVLGCRFASPISSDRASIQTAVVWVKLVRSVAAWALAWMMTAEPGA